MGRDMAYAGMYWNGAWRARQEGLRRVSRRVSLQQYSQQSKPVQSTVCFPKELLETRGTPVPVASPGAGVRGPPGPPDSATRGCRLALAWPWGCVLCARARGPRRERYGRTHSSAVTYVKNRLYRYSAQHNPWCVSVLDHPESL